MREAKYDVVGIGHAIVDILANATDAFLNEHGIAKGTMTLVDGFRAETLGRSMKNAIEASGGSGANTMVGIASFGGGASFIGKVNDDRLGQVFAEDIHKAAIEDGMLDLKMYSAWLIRQGLTNVEEVLQVVSVQD